MRWNIGAPPPELRDVPVYNVKKLCTDVKKFWNISEP
jgi:hypothetical protein